MSMRHHIGKKIICSLLSHLQNQKTAPAGQPGLFSLFEGIKNESMAFTEIADCTDYYLDF